MSLPWKRAAKRYRKMHGWRSKEVGRIKEAMRLAGVTLMIPDFRDGSERVVIHVPGEEQRAALAARTDSLDGLRALSDAATPGPWSAGTSSAPDEHIVPKGIAIYADRDSGPSYPGFYMGAVEVGADAAFIVAAVNYVRTALSKEPDDR